MATISTIHIINVVPNHLLQNPAGYIYPIAKSQAVGHVDY